MSNSRTDTLRAYFSSPNAAPRPLLTSLNGDNSWLISFPRPAAERARAGSKAYFHIVSDPWLTGYARLGAAWIYSLRTPTPAALIRRWAYFSHVTETRDLEPGNTWSSVHPGAPLPEWLTVFRLTGHHELYFATAIIYTSDSPASLGGEEKQHEAVLYSPHGIKADQLSLKAFLQNPAGGATVSVLAILHALKDNFALGMRFTLGVAGCLALERMARPRYWVKSHDMLLRYTGVAPWLIRVNDVARSLRSGLDEEAKDVIVGEDRGGRKEPNLVEVDNGGCFVLE